MKELIKPQFFREFQRTYQSSHSIARSPTTVAGALRRALTNRTTRWLGMTLLLTFLLQMASGQSVMAATIEGRSTQPTRCGSARRVRSSL